MPHQSEVREVLNHQNGAEQTVGEYRCYVAQELRIQIAQMIEELVGNKTWTDPISKMLWLNLACCAAGVPRREVDLPKTGELENMSYRQLSEAYEDVARKLKKEKGYWKHWQWVVNQKGDTESAVTWAAAAIRKHGCVILPEHVCLNTN